MSFVLTKCTDDEYSNEHMLLPLLEKSRLMVTFDYFTDESPSLSKVSKFEAEGNGTS